MGLLLAILAMVLIFSLLLAGLLTHSLKTSEGNFEALTTGVTRQTRGTIVGYAVNEDQWAAIPVEHYMKVARDGFPPTFKVGELYRSDTLYPFKNKRESTGRIVTSPRAVYVPVVEVEGQLLQYAELTSAQDALGEGTVIDVLLNSSLPDRALPLSMSANEVRSEDTRMRKARRTLLATAAGAGALFAVLALIA